LIGYNIGQTSSSP